MTTENLNLIANELFRANGIVYNPDGKATIGNARVVSEIDAGSNPANVVTIVATRKQNVEDVGNPDVNSGIWIEVTYKRGDPINSDGYYIYRRNEDENSKDTLHSIVLEDEEVPADKREEVAQKAVSALNNIPFRE